MTESRGLLKRMDSKFGYGINFDSITGPELISKLKENNIRVFTYGEIENYYTKEWLNNILEDSIDDLNFAENIKEDIKSKINSMTIPSQKDEIKRSINTTHNLELYDSDTINKIINIKSELLALNLDDEKVGKKLEKVFDALNLTKPKIAIRIREHINVEQIPENKKENLLQVINHIFT